MNGFMIRMLSGLALVVLAVTEYSTPRAAQALNAQPIDRTAVGQRPVGQRPGEQKPGQPAARRSLQFQELEDPVEPLEPLRPRTVSDQARVDALASFGRGRVLHSRGDLAGALAAYEQAVESDPT